VLLFQCNKCAQRIESRLQLEIAPAPVPKEMTGAVVRENPPNKKEALGIFTKYAAIPPRHAACQVK
jgi:hypothetical protein